MAGRAVEPNLLASLSRRLTPLSASAQHPDADSCPHTILSSEAKFAPWSNIRGLFRVYSAKISALIFPSGNGKPTLRQNLFFCWRGRARRAALFLNRKYKMGRSTSQVLASGALGGQFRSHKRRLTSVSAADRVMEAHLI
jgi:hypothetical protein